MIANQYATNERLVIIPDDPVVEVTSAPVDAGTATVEVALGGAVQLQCPEDTHGCWSRLGVGRLEPVGPGPRLALEDVLYQDAGEYRCVTARRTPYDKWRSELNVEVSVKGKLNIYQRTLASWKFLL